MDQCIHCVARGNMELCKVAHCSHHNSWYATEQIKTIETLRQRVKELETANELVKKRMDWEAGRAAKLDVALEDTTARAESFEGSFNACVKELSAERAISDKLEQALKDIRWQVEPDSAADVIAEAALAELAAMRKGKQND